MIDSTEQPRFMTALGRELARVARAEGHRARPTRRPARMRAVLAVIASTLALAAGAGAATGVVSVSDLIPGGPSPADVQRFAPAEASATFDPALVRELSVLQRPRTQADAMGTAAQHVSGDVAPGSSLRIAAPAPPAGTPHARATTLPAWVVPTSAGTAALYSLSPGATGPGTGVAADVAMLEQGHARMTVDDDLIGLAPDGVREVTVTLRDGSTVHLPVEGNVFGARFDQSVAGVELQPAAETR